MRGTRLSLRARAVRGWWLPPQGGAAAARQPRDPRPRSAPFAFTIPRHRIATEVLSHLPYGYEETLEVLGYLRQLAEWRHHGRVIPLPPRQAYPPAAAAQADR